MLLPILGQIFKSGMRMKPTGGRRMDHPCRCKKKKKNYKVCTLQYSPNGPPHIKQRAHENNDIYTLQIYLIFATENNFKLMAVAYGEDYQLMSFNVILIPFTV